MRIATFHNIKVPGNESFNFVTSFPQKLLIKVIVEMLQLEREDK
jgi:hypothetical protein